VWLVDACADGVDLRSIVLGQDSAGCAQVRPEGGEGVDLNAFCVK
jgi:hypothetical protein